jgi:hypothetical protein
MTASPPLRFSAACVCLAARGDDGKTCRMDTWATSLTALRTLAGGRTQSKEIAYWGPSPLWNRSTEKADNCSDCCALRNGPAGVLKIVNFVEHYVEKCLGKVSPGQIYYDFVRESNGGILIDGYRSLTYNTMIVVFLGAGGSTVLGRNCWELFESA